MESQIQAQMTLEEKLSEMKADALAKANIRPRIVRLTDEQVKQLKQKGKDGYYGF